MNKFSCSFVFGQNKSPDLGEELAQWLRSLPPNPEVPGSIPGLFEGWIFG